MVALQLGYAANEFADRLGFAPFRPSGFTYGLAVSVNLFDGFNRKRLVENARLRERMAGLAVTEARTRVLAELESGHASYRNRIVLVELEEDNTKLAAQNVEVALERFRLGLSTSLELREVQNALPAPGAGWPRPASRRSAPRSSCSSSVASTCISASITQQCRAGTPRTPDDHGG